MKFKSPSGRKFFTYMIQAVRSFPSVPSFSMKQYLFSRAKDIPSLWYFQFFLWFSESGNSIWESLGLSLLAHRRGGEMAVLNMLQPKLSGLESSGCPHPWLGLILPCREGASQLLGSAYQEREKMWCLMLHSPFCSCLSCIEKNCKVHCEDKSAFDFLNHFLMCMSFGARLDFGLGLRGQLHSPPAFATLLAAKS